MQDRPDKLALLGATAEFLAKQVAPAMTDRGLRFRVLVAANVVGVVARELATEDGHLASELARLRELLPALDLPAPGDVPAPAARREVIADANAALVAAIEDGSLDEAAALAHVKATLRDKLVVVNPRFKLSPDIE